MDSTWKLKFAFMICFLSKLHLVHAGLEAGIFKYQITGDEKPNEISKSLSNNTNVVVTAKCPQDEASPNCQIHLEWVLRFSDCDNSFVEINNNTNLFKNPENSMLVIEDIMRYQKSTTSNVDDTETCDHKTVFKDETYSADIHCFTTLNDVEHCETLKLAPLTEAPKTEDKHKPEDNDNEKDKADKGTRRKRNDEDQSVNEQEPKTLDESGDKPNTTVADAESDKIPNPKKPTKAPAEPDKTVEHKVDTVVQPVDRITQTWMDGRYLFVFVVRLTDCKDPNIEVTVEFKNKNGYLSAIDRPLLTFYAVMCTAYTILAFLWLLMMACQWRDILRIQFWICGVVILGLLEKVVFYSEYHHMNSTGESSPATLVFAELVSCLKRTVARMLVIIVSMGFGITKPRLGPQLHRVIGVGFLFFVLSSIEACLRVQGTLQQQLVASIPLAVLDAVICYWIFTNLVDTTRTLRLRRNVVKLWLYRHFTNSLIFCIIAAVIFLAWSMKTHKLAVCVSRWSELWLDDAYWHILFYIVLVVIIILWRPTANNQRYAYSPLTDALDDDESKEPMIPESFEGMKMRNVNRTDSTPTKVEDDLKWVEDNIPASVADAALAVFDDSDEEIVTSIERSKME